jgi:hypothetical protein
VHLAAIDTAEATGQTAGTTTSRLAAKTGAMASSKSSSRNVRSTRTPAAMAKFRSAKYATVPASAYIVETLSKPKKSKSK